MENVQEIKSFQRPKQNKNINVVFYRFDRNQKTTDKANWSKSASSQLAKFHHFPWKHFSSKREDLPFSLLGDIIHIYGHIWTLCCCSKFIITWLMFCSRNLGFYLVATPVVHLRAPASLLELMVLAGIWPLATQHPPLEHQIIIMKW